MPGKGTIDQVIALVNKLGFPIAVACACLALVYILIDKLIDLNERHVRVTSEQTVIQGRILTTLEDIRNEARAAHSRNLSYGSEKK